MNRNRPSTVLVAAFAAPTRPQADDPDQPCRTDLGKETAALSFGKTS